jgi:uncharacterized repeat protein (TIGR03803 family)
VLYSFTGTPDGARPGAALINLGGTLYGTTAEGGANNFGSVFAITPAGVETVIYSFKGSGTGPDGAYPEASLINVGGELYGTTYEGGDEACGTVFKVTPTGVETVLHAFDPTNDGCSPAGSLLNVGGTLYGTTAGADGVAGTVFKITRQGKETVLHSFKGYPGDGQTALAGLINVDGTLYGTTAEGGGSNLGTVFKISPAGVESVLYSFKEGTDAAAPEAPLLDVGGTLYGTSAGGGGNSCGPEPYS